MKRFFEIALLGFAASCADAPSDPSSVSVEALTSLPNETAWAKGTRWSYEASFAGLKAWVYRPATTSPKAPGKYGVVFQLVGCGQLTHQVAQGSGWPKVAEAHGLVIVVPEIVAPSRPNAASPNTACYDFGTSILAQPSRTSPDHKALIAAAQRLASEDVDPRQIYLTGLSAGATVAMQVACMAPDLFAAVGSVAGPAIGTDQSRAVMPPQTTATLVRNRCTSYADRAKAHLATQLYAIVSDDNGLPAGNPVMDPNGHWTADKFAKQTIWDGDKYVPHAHHDLIATAMAPLFEATKTGSGVALPMSGAGIGCPNGAQSQDDRGETECTFAEAVTRSWTVKANVWTDRRGKKRIVHLEQDTLRHRWPVGPLGPLDHVVVPGRDALVEGGYILPNGQFDIEKLNRAPNGMIGSVFFANDAFDFPTYFADFVAENNPRLGS